MGFELIKVTVALLIVLGGLYLLLRFLKQRVLPNKGLIEIVQYQPFGPKKGVAIVKVLKEYLVLGIADESISILSKPNPSDVEEAMKQQPAITSHQPLGIKDFIKRKFFYFALLPIASCLLPDLSFAAPAPPPPAGGFLGLTTPLELLLFSNMLLVNPTSTLTIHGSATSRVMKTAIIFGTKVIVIS